MIKLGKLSSVLVAFILVSAPFSAKAQNWQENLQEAKQLYVNKMYQSAQTLFLEAIKQIKAQGGGAESALEEAEGYGLLCGIYLSQNGTEKQASSYKRKYPSSPLIPQISFAAASVYFSKDNYSKALALMEELQPAEIDKDSRNQYLLQKGICLMKAQRMIEAQNHFMEIDPKSKLYQQGLYYLGYTDYLSGNFKEAIDNFTKSSHPKASLLTAECYFMLKDYRYVFEHANNINLYEGAEKARFARIVSESAYALGHSSEAQRYFNIYSNQKEMSKTDNFYSGMLAYTQGRWREAASMFEQCVMFGDADSLTQNAFYRLGRCYIEEKDKVSAADYFNKAAQLNFNQQVKEDAFFNYSKLSFDLWSNADALYEYLKIYNPDTQKKDETLGYIATKCLEDNNYQDAITALEQIVKPSVADISNLQKAYFLMGMELLDKDRYIPSQKYLRKASEIGNNQSISNLSAFWLAESLFRSDKFEESLALLEELQQNNSFKNSNEYNLSLFNSGYCRLRLNNLDAAYKDFLAYSNIGGDYSLEAILRMADIKFMQRDFSSASKFYSAVASTGNYSQKYLDAALQYAKAEGLMGNTKRKNEILAQYTSKKYSAATGYTEALYELGRTQVQRNDFKSAEGSFLKLVNNPTDSLFYTKSLIELGMLYANTGNNKKAKEYYKKVAAINPSSEDAQAAINAYQNICNQEGSPDEFLKWVAELQSSEQKLSGGKDEYIVLLFNSAEQVFLAEKYEAAAEGFRKFIEEYPLYQPEKSWYYLAESLSRLSEYSEAAEAYSKLADLATSTNSKNRYAMQEMQMLYQGKDFNKLILKSSAYIERLNLSEADNRQVSYFLGKALLNEGHADRAMEIIRELAETPTDIIGAEASYLIVKDAFDRGKFDKVEQLVFALAEENIDRYYLAKCYLLLGDSYLEQNDFEQAVAVYNSIYQSYKGDGQITQIAETKMKAAKEKLNK